MSVILKIIQRKMFQYYGRVYSNKECSKTNFQGIKYIKHTIEVVNNYQTNGVVVNPPYFEILALK
jgi:hypothetical protein